MPRRKPASARQNRETRDIGLVRLATGAVPDCPELNGKELQAGTQAAWVKFWSSDVAGLVLDADRPALVRLFGMYDLRERMLETYLAQPFSAGSMGQVKVHPAAAEVASLDARIQALEDRFGITPAARLKLGIVLGAAAKSLEEMNRTFNADHADEYEAGDGYDDPRLRVIERHSDG